MRGTGKAALYRRWPTQQELVLDALRTVLPDPEEVMASDDVRTVMLAALAVFNQVLASELGSPGIDVAAGLYRAPELHGAFVEQVVTPRLAVLERILGEAADRGEIGVKVDANRSAINALGVQTAAGFEETRRGFAEMRGKLDQAAAGQQQIVDLLTTLISGQGDQ